MNSPLTSTLTVKSTDLQWLRDKICESNKKPDLYQLEPLSREYEKLQGGLVHVR